MEQKTPLALLVAAKFSSKATPALDKSVNTTLRAIARDSAQSGLYGRPENQAEIQSQVDSWLDLIAESQSKEAEGFTKFVQKLNESLQFRTLLVEYNVTIADIAAWSYLKENNNVDLKASPHVGRYLSYLDSLPQFAEFAKQTASGSKAEVKPKDSGKGSRTGTQGSFDKLALEGAKQGEVITRFPPEPSGYLHIGHMKAALLNNYFAQHYDGKMILRFDDTNPAKEKDEFVESITQDLKTIGIQPWKVTYTSDYFDVIMKYGDQILKEGKAFIDNTPVEQSRNERLKSIESKNRNNTIEENLRLWEEMKRGSDEGKQCVMRGKIDMKSKNGALRDPSLYRCVDSHHNRTGAKYKVYPLYDFACPIVDSLEGVTHALRSSEYHDRNPLYDWILDTLRIRKVVLQDFSRLNFSYTLLSKRKLQKFVDTGLVDGWNDPRFPTIQGMLRRGLTVEALREFILSLGASKTLVLMEIEKLWAVNKKIIDPIVPRYTVVADANKVPFTIKDGPNEITFKSIPRHAKNPDLGNKTVAFFNKVWIEQADAAVTKEGEEVTLMAWGNVIVDKINRDGEKVVSMEGHLHLEGSVKDTKQKWTWIADSSDNVKVNLVSYDHLITKSKMEEFDNVDDFINKESKTEIIGLGDPNLRLLKKGDRMQLERRGYFICDQIYFKEDKPIVLILIPDGHTTKAQSALTTKPTATNADQKK